MPISSNNMAAHTTSFATLLHYSANSSAAVFFLFICFLFPCWKMSPLTLTLHLSLLPVPLVPTGTPSHLLSQTTHCLASAGDVYRSWRDVRDPVSQAPSLLSDGP